MPSTQRCAADTILSSFLTTPGCVCVSCQSRRCTQVLKKPTPFPYCLRVRISAPENRRLPARLLSFPFRFRFLKCTATTAAVKYRRGRRPVMPRALLPASPHSSQICVNNTNALESFYLSMYSLARRRGVHNIVHALDTKIGQSRRR